MDEGPTISTHVLDTENGRPAVGVAVTLLRIESDQDTKIGEGTTDADGRIRRLVATGLEAGTYRLEFAFDGPFFRQASVTFAVGDTSRSYHVPLLISPYSLSTYRGS